MKNRIAMIVVLLALAAVALYWHEPQWSGAAFFFALSFMFQARASRKRSVDEAQLQRQLKRYLDNLEARR